MNKLIGFVALLAVAGCGNGGIEPVDALPPAPIASTVVDTTSPPPATSTTAAPLPPTTLAPEPTSTAAPSPTLPVEDQIRAAFDSYEIAYTLCLEAPPLCDPARFTAGRNLVFLRDLVAQFVEGGVYSGPGVEPEYYRVESVELAQSRTTAVVRICEWDTGVLYKKAPGDGQPPGILNDLMIGKRIAYEMALQGVSWFVVGGEVTDERDGVDICAA